MVKKILKEISKGFICSWCENCENNPQAKKVKHKAATVELTEKSKNLLRLFTYKSGMPEPCEACYAVRELFRNNPDYLVRDLYERFMREAEH